jgi:hypothetical protein
MTSRPQSDDERRQTPPSRPIAMIAAPHEGESRVSAVFAALARAISPEGLTLQDLLAWLGERGLLTHRAPWLPGRLWHHRLAADALFGVCTRRARLFTRLERFIDPRVPPLTHGPTMGHVNGLLLVLSGVLLMAPLPLPMSNTLPAYGASCSVEPEWHEVKG